jgi:phage protein D
MRRDRPIYFVKVYPDGKAKKGRVLDLSKKVLSYMYLDRSTKADRLELKVNNSDLRFFDDPVLRKGAILEVCCGYPGNLTERSWCVIKGVKGGVELTVEALSQGILLHQVRKCRVWKNTTLQQMADKVQFEYQSILMYEDAVNKDPNLRTLGDNLQIIHASQAAMTDAEFLAKQAKKFGLIFRVRKNGLVSFEDPNMKKPPVRTITWRGGTGDWETFSIHNDITALVGSVTSKGINTKTKGATEHKAGDENTTRDGLMPVKEVVDPETLQTRYEVDDTEFNQAQALVVAAQAIVAHAASSVETTTTAEAGKAHVQAKAEGKFKASQRGTIKLEGTLVGDPRLAAGQLVMVAGLGKRLSGRYRLIQVRHEIAHRGAYRTHFVAKTDGHGGYQGGSGNAPNQASLNTEKPKDTPDATKIERHEVVDQQTLQTHYEFHRSGE